MDSGIPPPARSSQKAPVRPGRSAGASRAGPVALIWARAGSGKTNRLGQVEARPGRPSRSLISRGDHGFGPEPSAGLRLVLEGPPSSRLAWSGETLQAPGRRIVVETGLVHSRHPERAIWRARVWRCGSPVRPRSV